MTIFEFMNQSPWPSFFILLLIFSFLKTIFYRLPRMIIRGYNIRKHGWPPEYCDADGDFNYVENDNK